MPATSRQLTRSRSLSRRPWSHAVVHHGAQVARSIARSVSRGRRMDTSSVSTRSYRSKSRGRTSSRGKRNGLRQMQTSGDDEGKSWFKNVHRSRKKYMKGFKRVCAPTFMLSNTGQRMVSPSTSGEQGVHDLPSWEGTGVQELANFGQQMLQDINATLAAIEPTAATQNQANTTALTRKIMIKSVTTAYQLKNMTNSPVRVILYNCVLRRDQQTVTRPSTVWAQGVINEAIPLAGNANLLGPGVPGATPFQSEQFCQFFKVRKVTKFELHPGSVHVHRVTTRPAGLLSAEYFNNFKGYRGLTSYVMAVVTGGITEDIAALTSVSTSQYAIDMIAETRIEATTFERSRSAYVSWNKISTVIPILQQANMDEDTDVVDTVKVA